MKAFVTSQFGYCPLVWKFRSRGLNNKINSLWESVLRITYSDKSSSFQDLLKKQITQFLSIHRRNIQSLATEMLKVKNNISPEIMKELFAPHDIRYNNSLKRRRVNPIWHGTRSVP